MKHYKLTDENNQTYNGTQWGEGVTHKAVGEREKLCTGDVIHVYDHPLKAVMFNPIHANFNNPHLWEVKVQKVVANDKLKVGVKQCTTLRQIPLPEITTEQRVRFAIYCALEVYRNERFVKWANDWLNGTDRSAEAAEAAALWATRAASIWATRAAAIWAAEVATRATRAAEVAARTAEAAALWATRAAAIWAAEVAARTAEAEEIDFVRLIKKAMKETK